MGPVQLGGLAIIIFFTTFLLHMIFIRSFSDGVVIKILTA